MCEDDRYQKAVEYARRCLGELFDTLSYFESEPGIRAQELEPLDFLEHLEKQYQNHAARTDYKATRGEKLWKIQLSQARAKGLSPNNRVQGERQLYPATLRHLIRISAWNMTAFDALCLHGAGFIADDRKMPLALREFLVGVLKGKLSRPRQPGRPKTHPSRDPLLFACLAEVADRFGLKPTRNDATGREMSACDIVAVAMRQLGHSPTSYPALKRIWLNQNDL